MTILVTGLKYLWALPWTLVGIAIGFVGVATGGKMAFVEGVFEFWGGCLPRWLNRAPFVRDACAMTIGHVVIGRSADTLDSVRTHEQVHVRQYERWGIFFVPAYLANSVGLSLRGRDPYRDNLFEREAFAEGTPPGPEPWWWIRPSWLLIAAFLVALPSTAAHFGAFHWWLDLGSHFRVQYLLVLGPLVMGLWIRGRFRTACLLGLALLDNAVSVGGVYVAKQREIYAATPVRILSTNVLSGNRQYQRLLDNVREEAPDFVFAFEVNDRWLNQLRTLEDQFPDHQYVARNDNFGIVFLSRQPVDDIEVVDLGSSDLPSIRCRVSVGGRTVVLWGIHALPPINAQYAAERDQALREVADWVTACPDPVMVIGDFNATPWCVIFRELRQRTGLIDSRAGYGNQASWPTMIWPLRIPIDHCLVSPEIMIHDRRLGRYVGSDHRPIVVDFSITAPATPK